MLENDSIRHVKCDPSLRRLILLLLLSFACAVAAVRGEVKFWDGSSSGNWSLGANWTDGTTPVAGDDLVFPGGVTRLLVTNDFSPNRAFRSITIQGTNYFLRASAGQTLNVTNGVSAQNLGGANTIDMNIVMGGTQTFDCLNGPATLDINGGVAMGAFNLTISGDGDIFIAGAMTGTASLTKNGLGTLLFNGAGTNTYTGVTTVNAGTLQLFRRVLDGVVFVPVTAIAGDLVIGSGTATDTVQLFEDDQIANTSDVRVNAGGVLNLNTFSDWIAALTMAGGTVETGTGLLRLGGNISVLAGSPTSFINGNLSLGETSRIIDVDSVAGPGLRINANIRSDTLSAILTAGITKTGTGVLWLDGTNTYNGTTFIEDGQITISSDRALGTTVNVFGNPVGTFVNGDATFFIAGANVTNELLTLNSTNASFVVASSGVNTWAGDITINSNAIFSVNATSLLVEGTITGAGALTKIGAGTLTLGGTNENTFTGAVAVNAGVLALDKPASVPALRGGQLTIGDGLGGEDADVVRYLASSQYDGVLTIRSSGLLDLNNFNEALQTITLDGGDIETGTGTLGLNGNIVANGPTNTATIEGRLSLFAGTRTFDIDAGSVTPGVLVTAVISGSGALTKTGGGQLRLEGANTYTGVTTLDQGVLWVTQNTGLGTAAGGTVLESGILVIDSAAVAGEALTVSSAARIDTTGICSWIAGVTLNANLTVLTFSDVFDINGTIVGTGGIIKSQTGTLRLSGTADNTYAGTTTVNEGILELNKSGSSIEAIRGSSLVIGDGVGGDNVDIVRYIGTSTSQIFSGAPITVNVSGLLDLNNHTDDIGALTLNAGSVQTGTGTLILTEDITATSDPVASEISGIAGRVELFGTRVFNIIVTTLIPQLRISADVRGSGSLTKSGNGYLALSGSNSYAGVTMINNGRVWVEDPFAFGSTNAGTVVNGPGVVELLSGAHVPLEPLTLNSTNSPALSSLGATNSWAGNIVLQTNTIVRVVAAGNLALSGAISGPGGLTKIGPGNLYLSGNVANTYAGITRVNEGRVAANKTAVGGDGAIPAELIVGDGLGGVDADVFEVLSSSQINDLAAVTINSSGLLDITGSGNEDIGSLSGNGHVELGTHQLGPGFNNDSTVFSGRITGGTGRLWKVGTGTLTLQGNNTYGGLTRVARGTLLVNGSQFASPVEILPNAILGGDGIVGNVTNAAGTVAPGSSPAILTTSNLVLQAGSDFNVELNGPAPGTGYDQANVRGIVNLGAATATLNVNVGFPPTEGGWFTIIDNDGAEAVVGTFAGLPNGATFFADGLQFRILYSDIFLNDVILIVTNTALRVTNVVVSAGNGNGAVDPNECNELTIPLRNPFAGVLASGVSGLLSTETPGVVITQPYSLYPDIPAATTRNNNTPFQFSTTSDFLCGTNIDFTLTVATATNGSFQVHFSLPTGSAGAAVAFNNNTVQAIPDLGTLNSLINVAGITTPIKRVTVSLHITHTAASDLDISLIGPDGTIVELSSDNGGAASDYGTDCTAGARTTFSDLATVAITAGSAPFVGTFRPEQTLRAFNEKFGADVNGTWTLRVVDDTGGAVGSVRCWTLNIHPTACSPGDGACEGCGGPIAGVIAASDPLQTGRLIRDGVPSNCDSPKVCPGLFSATPFRYDAYMFTNGNVDACVVVQMSTECSGPFTAAYAGTYNPADLCLNYLGDPGLSATNVSYSFFVPSNSVFTVVVHEVAAGAACTNYTLNVSGFECPPRLHIEPAGAARVALKWSTSGVGYRLLSATDVSPSPGFAPVAGTPFVVEGKYTVTNVISGQKRFYELRKP